MHAKRPLTFLLVAVLAIGLLAAASGTVAAQSCSAEATSGDIAQLMGMDNDASSVASAAVDNDQGASQTNLQSNDQNATVEAGGDAIVSQSSLQAASQEISQSQC
jgi:hypothetical protein